MVDDKLRFDDEGGIRDEFTIAMNSPSMKNWGMTKNWRYDEEFAVDDEFDGI